MRRRFLGLLAGWMALTVVAVPTAVGWYLDFFAGRGGPDMMPIGVPLSWLLGGTVLVGVGVRLLVRPTLALPLKLRWSLLPAVLLGFALPAGCGSLRGYLRHREIMDFELSQEAKRSGGKPLSLPFNPFETASEGDWAEYAVFTVPNESATGKIRFEVEGVKGDLVTLHIFHRDPYGRTQAEERQQASRKGLPTCQDFLRLCGLRPGSLKRVNRVAQTQEKAIYLAPMVRSSTFLSMSLCPGTKEVPKTYLHFYEGDDEVMISWAAPIKALGLESHTFVHRGTGHGDGVYQGIHLTGFGTRDRDLSKESSGP